jgi:hypothetical protein
MILVVGPNVIVLAHNFVEVTFTEAGLAQTFDVGSKDLDFVLRGLDLQLPFD